MGVLFLCLCFRSCLLHLYAVRD
uniref:Uncharacterized protein n=1 Tax=Anguilla anguilla TaxID=7936 RepID=A0A0E9XM38_ANGAN